MSKEKGKKVRGGHKEKVRGGHKEKVRGGHKEKVQFSRIFPSCLACSSDKITIY